MRFTEAQRELAKGRLDQGYDIVNKISTAREQLCGENHARLKPFLHRLLKAYCQALQDEFAGETQRFRNRTNFTDDILEFCIATERYQELEVLLQERRTRFHETRSTSPDDKFWPWAQQDTGAQSQLAQLRSPGEDFYWEDSRTYTKTWDSLKLARVRAAEVLPELPLSIVVHSGAFEYSDPADEEKLKGSEIFAVLDRKRRAEDWDILAAWDQQPWQAASKEFARSDGPHKVWIYSEDIVSCEANEYEYGFVHVSPDRSEWMAVRQRAITDRPNEPTTYRNSPRDMRYKQRRPRPIHREGRGCAFATNLFVKASYTASWRSTVPRSR